MRPLLILSLFTLAMTGVAADEKAEAIKFNAFTSYFENNDSGLKGKSSYLVIPDAKTFYKIFGIGFRNGGGPPTLPDNAFANSLIVAVIKRGDGNTNYKPESVKAVDGNLTVSYQANTDPPGTATFRSPLIFTIDKGKYKSVTFLENGKKVETIDLKELVK